MTISLVTLIFLLVWPFVDWYLRTAGIAEPFQYYDFGAYMSAVHNWHAGDPIYQQTESGGYFGSYLYPPVVLLLLDQFAALSFYSAGLAWGLFSLGLLWVGIQWAIAAYGLELRLVERGLLLWALFGFQPLLFSFKHGQVAIFLGAMLSFALVALERGKKRERGRDGNEHETGWRVRYSRFASGALTTVTAAVKLTFLTAGAHLLRDRDRLLGAIGTGGVLLGISLLVFGWDTHLAYLDVLRWGIESGDTPRPPQLMTIAYYHPLSVITQLSGSVSTVVRVLGVVGIVGLSLAAASGDADRATFALGVAAVPLLAPQRYTYTFVALLPAIVALLAGELRRDGQPVVPVLALLLFHVHAWGLKLLVDYLPARFGIFEAIQPAAGILQPGLWGNLLLVCLAAVRVAGSVPESAWLWR